LAIQPGIYLRLLWVKHQVYVPACTSEALPLDILQKVFVESYGLKKYIPTIMQPAHFYFEMINYPFYSLQNPSHMHFLQNQENSRVLYLKCEN